MRQHYKPWHITATHPPMGQTQIMATCPADPMGILFHRMAAEDVLTYPEQYPTWRELTDVERVGFKALDKTKKEMLDTCCGWIPKEFVMADEEGGEE